MGGGVESKFSVQLRPKLNNIPPKSLFGVKRGLKTINRLFRSNLMMMFGNYDNGITGT